MHAMQVTVATSLGSMPGARRFSRAMFLNIPLMADWHTIAQHCKQNVNDNLHHANRKRHQYNYAPGQQVPRKVHDPTKLGGRTAGPYTIEQAHVKGTRTIESHPGLAKQINILNVFP
jgi:hypothetical protein